MKRVLLSSMLLCICFTLKAQNTFPTTGNVGIGTTSPSHKFEVNTGGARFKTYTYGVETTVNDSGGWARAFRFRNEYNNVTAALGSLDGSFYIATGFNISLDATGYLNQKFTVATNGNVGIGTTSPQTKLDVKGIIKSSDNAGNELFMSSSSNGSYIRTFGSQNFNLRNSVGTSMINFDMTSGSARFNGSIVIGSSSIPSGYMLAVAGKVITEEVKVKLQSGWPDYVFQKEYKLPTLKEVEKHIKEKGHLKNIPSEKEVLKNGIQLGEMNAKLLRKIEELTLYTIAQEKKIQQQEKELHALKKLSKRLAKIEALLQKK